MTAEPGRDARVLVLGAGLVAPPLVRYLLERGATVTVASQVVSRARELVGNHPRGHGVGLDVPGDMTALEELVEEADVVVSLLPASFHPVVGRTCVEYRTHLVTTSYVSDEMRSLDARARERGVVLLNECGLDPGIDHMAAMRVIHRVREEGGRLVALHSYCGGLPAPEVNDNPWGYKFSWNPRGVLLAARNPARYLFEGRVVDVPPERLFDNCHYLDIAEVGRLQSYPNRDATVYVEKYGLAGIRTMFRGTLRYPGHCVTFKQLAALGLLDLAEMDLAGETWAGLMRRLAGGRRGEDPREAVARKLGIGLASEPMRRFDWLGLFAEEPLPPGARTPLDALVARMEERLRYRPGERDMVVLHDEFLVVADGETRPSRVTVTLLAFGEARGDSAMARTVGLPAAIATRLILEGKVADPGVRLPTTPDLYEPILAELAEHGIRLIESREGPSSIVRGGGAPVSTGDPA